MALAKGAQLSAQQIAAACLAAGFRNGEGYQNRGLDWAVATVLAESGGNGNAVNTSNADGTTDHGYFQWNSRWHPEGVAIAGDMMAEAKLAMAVTNHGADWHQWSTFPVQSGAQLPTAATATAAVQKLFTANGGAGSSFWDAVGSGAADLGKGVAAGSLGLVGGVLGNSLGLDGIASAVKAIAGAVLHSAEWISNAHNWVRVIEVAGGLALVAGGVLLVKPQLAAVLGPEGAIAGEVAASAEHDAPAADAD